MTKSCISCHVCLNNIFLATYKGMRCSTRLLHSSVLIMLASVGFHLNEWNDLIKQMVAIPSHLTDKTNSLKSNTTILESHSKHLMYGPNTCLCAVLSGTWTGSKSWVDLVCCEVCNPCLIASGSGEFWGQCDAFDLLSHLNNSRAVLAVWRGALVPPPPNQLAVPSWASKQLQVSNWSLSSYWREFFSCHQAVAHREWSDCFFFSIIVESLLNK